MNCIKHKVRNGLYRLLRSLVGPGKGVRVILLYHSVSKDAAETSYSVSRHDFEDQMAFLHAHFKVVRLCDLAQIMQPEPSNTNIAVVTFDDGCIDNYEVALPVLERFDIKATFFIIAGRIGQSFQTSSLWKTRLMEKVHIQELHSLGHEIGAHTMSHVKLTQIPIEKVREEVQRSKQWLEDLIGHEVSSFAYPAGKYNNHVKQEVAQAGFRWAVTVREGLVSPNPDWLALPRVWISNYLSFPAFTAKVSPAVEWYERIRGRK